MNMRVSFGSVFILVEISLKELLGLVRIRVVFDVIAQMFYACRARVGEMD
jgi:hypothetical protein